MSINSIDFSKDVYTDSEKQIMKKECARIKDKYTDFVPIILKTKSKDLKLIKHKYLVSGSITVGQFLHSVRQKVPKLRSSEALFLFVDNVLPASSELLSLVYSTYKCDETDMLFLTLCKESTFG